MLLTTLRALQWAVSDTAATVAQFYKHQRAPHLMRNAFLVLKAVANIQHRRRRLNQEADHHRDLKILKHAFGVWYWKPSQDYMLLNSNNGYDS